MSKNEIIIPSCYFLHITQNVVDFCTDDAGKINDCAAALLVFLIRFHNGKQELKAYNAIMNQNAKADGRQPFADETDWQFHTDALLCKRLFFWKTDTIKKAIDYLRDDKKIIRTDAPVNLRKQYKTGRTKWFLVDFIKLNRYTIETYYNQQYPAADILPIDTALAPLVRTPTMATAMRLVDSKTLFELWRLVFNKMRVKPDDKPRLSIIGARLKDKSFAECVQAIFGNARSPYHVDGGWNKISNIFGNNEKVEWFIDVAENHEISEHKAIEMAERILAAGKPLKTRGEAANSAKPMPVNATALRKVAGVIIEHVVKAKMKFNAFIEFFYNNAETLGVSLLDFAEPAELAKTVIDEMSADSIVSDARATRVTKFCERFCAALMGEETTDDASDDGK